MRAKPLAMITVICLISALQGAQADTTTLSAQDYQEIQQLYARYNVAIDTGDAEAYAATFTPDGVFNNFKGHDELVGFIKIWRGERLNGANRRHWNTNLLISGDGKTATGSVSLMLLDVSATPVSIAAVATYSDSLIKTADGWRFSKRTTHSDSAAPTGASPAASAPPSPK
jgi:actinorhodin biosynthesis protein ActVIA